MLSDLSSRAVPLACPYEGHGAVISGHERSAEYATDLPFLTEHLFDTPLS